MWVRVGAYLRGFTRVGKKREKREDEIVTVKRGRERDAKERERKGKREREMEKRGRARMRREVGACR